MTNEPYNRPLHWLAIATVVATFPLIWMGGLVTSHGAGMSVPDWPNSYGYNMFLFPPSQWVGGIFYEHVHRLMGTVVGFLAIALVVVAWRVEPRRWVRWLCVGVLVAVIVQGVLGGLRVVMVERDLAIVHACFAQAFFCLAGSAAVVTSRWWHRSHDVPAGDHRAGRRLVWLAGVCVVAIYAQLIVGAVQRHYRAGLAIPDLPLAYGEWLPPTDEAGLRAVNRVRVWQLDPPLEQVTLDQIWWHFGHRVGAVVVSVVLLATIGYVLTKPNLRRRFAGTAGLLLALLATQVTLGVYVVLMRKPADLASLHVACGAVLLLTTFVLTVRAARVFRRRPAPVAETLRAARFAEPSAV